jgi:hypothetical protein
MFAINFAGAFILSCDYANEQRNDYINPKIIFSNGLACKASEDYHCGVRAYKIEGIVKNQSQRMQEVKIFKFQRRRLMYVLENVGFFYPNIEVFACNYCEIISIERSDLKQFPKLKVLELYDNKIRSIPGDLFQDTPEVVSFEFTSNKIAGIGKGFFEHLKKLISFHMGDNSCYPSEDIWMDNEKKKKDVIAKCTEKMSRKTAKQKLEREILYPFDPVTQKLCNDSTLWLS